MSSCSRFHFAWEPPLWANAGKALRLPGVNSSVCTAVAPASGHSVMSPSLNVSRKHFQKVKTNLLSPHTKLESFPELYFRPCKFTRSVYQKDLGGKAFNQYHCRRQRKEFFNERAILATCATVKSAPNLFCHVYGLRFKNLWSVEYFTSSCSNKEKQVVGHSMRRK